MTKNEILNKAYESINFYCKKANYWLENGNTTGNTSLFSDNEQKALAICYFLEDLNIISQETRRKWTASIIHACFHYSEEY